MIFISALFILGALCGAWSWSKGGSFVGLLACFIAVTLLLCLI